MGFCFVRCWSRAVGPVDLIPSRGGREAAGVGLHRRGIKVMHRCLARAFFNTLFLVVFKIVFRIALRLTGQGFAGRYSGKTRAMSDKTRARPDKTRVILAKLVLLTWKSLTEYRGYPQNPDML